MNRVVRMAAAIIEARLQGGVNSDIHFSEFTYGKITGKLCAQLPEILGPYKNLEIRESEPFLYTIFDIEWGSFTGCV